MSDVSILVVEDEAVTGMDLQKSLTELGYLVCAIATTGESAVKKAGELHPNLILMDIMLAGKMNGIEAAGIIKEKYRIPVVYLTAYSDDSYLARAKITEPYGYILKPFREMELKTTIEMAVYKCAVEHALRVNEETTRVLLNATEDLLLLIDPRGKILAVNQALGRRVGKEIGVFIGSDIRDLVTQGHISSRMAAGNLPSTQQIPVHFREEFHHDWYDVSIYPVASPDGKVVLFAVSIRNVTSSRKREEQSRQNEECFRSLIEDNSDIIAILNLDGTIRHESPSITRHLGYPPEQVVARSLEEFVSEVDIPRFARVLNDIREKPGVVKPLRLMMRDTAGTVKIMEGIISNLYGNPVIDGIILNGWIRGI